MTAGNCLSGGRTRQYLVFTSACPARPPPDRFCYLLTTSAYEGDQEASTIPFLTFASNLRAHLTPTPSPPFRASLHHPKKLSTSSCLVYRATQLFRYSWENKLFRSVHEWQGIVQFIATPQSSSASSPARISNTAFVCDPSAVHLTSGPSLLDSSSSSRSSFWR